MSNNPTPHYVNTEPQRRAIAAELRKTAADRRRKLSAADRAELIRLAEHWETTLPKEKGKM